MTEKIAAPRPQVKAADFIRGLALDQAAAAALDPVSAASKVLNTAKAARFLLNILT